MSTVVIPVSELPASNAVTIRRGNTFRGPITRHKKKDGSYIDTSLWTITGALYDNDACDANKLIDLTIEKQPGPEFGYRPTLTPAQTAGLTCGEGWYDIPTDDGTTVRTYVDGLATIEGVG